MFSKQAGVNLFWKIPTLYGDFSLRGKHHDSLLCTFYPSHVSSR